MLRIPRIEHGTNTKGLMEKETKNKPFNRNHKDTIEISSSNNRESRFGESDTHRAY